MKNYFVTFLRMGYESMVKEKNVNYLLEKIITDLEFAVNNSKGISLEEFCKDELLNSAISFKFIQISENAKKLPIDFTNKHSSIPWGAISGLRNKIVHDYGHVQLDTIYSTLINDLPILLDQIIEIKETNN